MVLQACPDIVQYAKGGIANWRDLEATAGCPLHDGNSPSAWAAAQSAMGEIPAAIVLAAILQRAEAIVSAGGYRQGIDPQSRGREFSPGPMLMALITAPQTRKKARVTRSYSEAINGQTGRPAALVRALNHAYGLREGVLDVQGRGVQMHGVGRGAHGSIQARRVTCVAFDDFSEDLGFYSLPARGRVRGPCVGRARRGSRSREFSPDVRARADHRADVRRRAPRRRAARRNDVAPAIEPRAPPESPRRSKPRFPSSDPERRASSKSVKNRAEAARGGHRRLDVAQVAIPVDQARRGGAIRGRCRGAEVLMRRQPSREGSLPRSRGPSIAMIIRRAPSCERAHTH